MNLQNHNIAKTCILLFAQSEKQESITKPIVSSNQKNQLLWKKMNERVLKTIKKTKIKYYHSNEKNQVGANFGEKITHAIQTVFEEGYENVIVIGNDSPQLTTKTLLETTQKIQSNDFIFGPDKNGGVYLIAISKKNFNKKNFTKLSWKTSNLFEEIKTTYANNRVEYLEQLNDVNNISDVSKVAYTFTYNNIFRAIILSVIHKLEYNQTRNTHFESIENNTFIFNKGSPNNYLFQ